MYNKRHNDDTKKEVINELYNAALLTAGVAGLSMVTKKAFGEILGAPVTLKGALKLTVGIAGSAVVVGYLKNKGYIPISIDK